MCAEGHDERAISNARAKLVMSLRLPIVSEVLPTEDGAISGCSGELLPVP